MGRHLQVRVVAQTYRPEDILKDWPRLAHLAWEGELALPNGVMRGVLDLVQDLFDKLRFDAPSEARKALSPGVEKAMAAKRALEEALSSWDAAEANRLSQDIEQLLDDLEMLAPETPFVVSKPK